MSDHQHNLTFAVRGTDWQDVEKNAAQLIRLYTLEKARGKYRVSDDAVLRNAAFTVDDLGEDGLWNVTVEVTV